MIKTLMADQPVVEGSLANLEDLRNQLTGRLALLLAGAGGLGIWLTLPLNPFPLLVCSLLAVCLALGLVARSMVKPHPLLARHVLVWGLTGGLLVAMGLLADPWVPFLGLLLAFIGAMLFWGGAVITAGLIAAVAVWLNSQGFRLYPLPGLFITLSMGVALAWLVVRTLYTAIQWAWNMQQQANHLLDEVRDRQAEVSRVLKSSELANLLLRRTQHELVTARKQAEEARLMKEQFAANISHELRTPLNLILGFSELMYLWPEVYGEVTWPPRLRRAVYQIYRSSRHLLEMIDDILDLSRFDMVGFSLNKERTPLEPLLREAAGIVEDMFRSDSVDLVVDIAPDLPDLEIDRTRIRQVILNLLNNALRFTEAGLVRLAARQIDGQVQISVSDTGCGIPAEKLAHIFDEFYQVDLSIRRSHQGAGLGLAISKRFVQAHEGRVWAESQEGAGSTFSFTLPVPGHLPSLPPYVKQPPEAQWPEPRPAVVLVDSDPALASLIQRYLEGFNLVTVTEPARLMETITLQHPRAIIYNLPGKPNGDGVLSNLPVPLITCSLPSQAWAAARLAVHACLTKPVTAGQLLAEMDKLGQVQDVLIIDDDRGFGQLVELILETGGRDLMIRHAYDGDRGLRMMNDRRPDLVLLDLVMPSRDGLQILEVMRQTPVLADVPVILLSGTSYTEEIWDQGSSQMSLQRSDGLRPAEVMRCLRAVIGVLESPTWPPPGAAQPVHHHD